LQRGEISILTLFGAGGAALRYGAGIRVVLSIRSVMDAMTRLLEIARRVQRFHGIPVRPR
jgi:hypothetical protein